jgi:4-aminobutyrate aminotransferase-like enzyme/Ser/Thr protein kinase RdoA (MazF antagonist)
MSLTLSPHDRPALSEGVVRRLVKKHYGLDGDLTPLPAEWDQNFLLDAGKKGRFVIKIANKGHSPGSLDLQDRALVHLAGKSLELGIPRILESRSGETTCNFKRGDTEKPGNPGNNEEIHRIRVLTWLEGQSLNNAGERSKELLASLGRAVGELDSALADFHHPAMDRDLAWDLRRFDWISDQTARIRNPGHRRLVERMLVQFIARTAPLHPLLEKSVIHNDANEENVLVSPEKIGQWKVTGLLDFGDMVWSNTVNDLAIASAYALFGCDDPLESLGHLVHGYTQARHLSDPEFEALFPLICMRLCMSVTNSAIAAEDDPGNEHRLKSEPRAWELLERLESIEWTEAEERLRAGVDSPDVSDSPDEAGLPPAPRVEQLLEQRGRHLAPSLSLAYEAPLLITRGRGTYLFEPSGRAYLDCVNNVCHVGHSHPRVVEAIAEQAAALNTNTRYLHPLMVEYARRLLATLPEYLAVCTFVNSGSEANELAIRMARSHTGRRDALVLEDAYHGNTGTLVEMSPYKAEGKGGSGLASWAHRLGKPDPYRGAYRGYGEKAGKAYAAGIGVVCRDLAAKGTPPAFFICEPAMGCGGQIVFPDGFMKTAFDLVREAGGVCIADEVQVGFGRVGSHMWAFETQGALPDIVTLGKPMGNGHPLGAVITTRAIAASFNNGMEFFSTFGGNPVSMAAGLAVLDVIEEEELQSRAMETGRYLRDGFRLLAETHAIIGDVRGMGLFMGVELVRDRETLEPATEETARLIEGLRSDGILVTAEGPHANVLKIKPPLQFGELEADLLLAAIDRGLAHPGGQG